MNLDLSSQKRERRVDIWPKPWPLFGLLHFEHMAFFDIANKQFGLLLYFEPGNPEIAHHNTEIEC